MWLWYCHRKGCCTEKFPIHLESKIAKIAYLVCGFSGLERLKFVLEEGEWNSDMAQCVHGFFLQVVCALSSSRFENQADTDLGWRILHGPDRVGGGRQRWCNNSPEYVYAQCWSQRPTCAARIRNWWPYTRQVTTTTQQSTILHVWRLTQLFLSIVCTVWLSWNEIGI